MTNGNEKYIEEIIKKADQKYLGWREYIKSNGKTNIKDTSELQECISRLLSETREYLKSDDPHRKEVLSDLIQDNILSEILIDQAEKTLIHYRAMEPVRCLERDDIQLCRNLFSDIMENYIVRVDINCLNRFEKYKFQNSEEMQKIMESLDTLSDYYIGNSFTKDSIKEDFGIETELSDSICDYYAELIDQSYYNIKLNLILGRISFLEKKIEELSRLHQNPVLK